MGKNNTIHLTYCKVQDSEDRYDEFFKIHHTILEMSFISIEEIKFRNF